MQPPATLLIRAYADSIGSRGGSGGAVLYPSGQRTDPRTAALINGTAVHTIEFDEIYRDALYRLGAPVISAATARSAAAVLAAVRTPDLNSNQAPTECSVFLQPRPRVESTHRPAQSQCYLKQTRLTM